MPNKNKNIPKRRFKEFENADAWELRKLNNIADVRDGTHNSPRYIEFGYPLVTSKNIKNGQVNFEDIQYISSFDYEEINKRSKVNINDILMGMIGTVGNLALVREEPKFAIKNVALIKNIGVVNVEFLYHYLGSYVIERQLQNSLDGGTQKFISLNKIRHLDITFPSLPEQEVIGTFFSTLDQHITLHQRKLDKLKSVKQAYLSEMFPAEGERVPKRRFPGFTDDWELRKLGDIVKELKRSVPTSDAPVMMITANNGFIEQSERYSFNNAGESLKKYILLKKGELAYNHGASKARPFGSCFSLFQDEARVPFVYHCFSSPTNNSDFLSMELNGKRVENQLRKLISSGARMDGLLNISFEEYSSVNVLIPTIDEQSAIGTFFSTLDRHITLHQRKLEKLKNLKKALLNELFV